MRMAVLTTIGAIAFMVAGLAVAVDRPSPVDDIPISSPINATDPWHRLSTPTPPPTALAIAEPGADPTPVVGPITEEQAREIGLRFASRGGDVEATLTSLEQRTLGEVIRDQSPGTKIYGWPMDMQVFALQYTGGPFDLVRSRPISRPETVTMFTEMYIVIAVENGEVLGVGSMGR